MNKLQKYIAIVSLASFSFGVNAQVVSPVDFMRMNPFQTNANPAVELPYESVGAFAIGDMALGFQNTSLRYDNVFDFDAQGRPKTINLRKLANSLNDENSLDFSLKENVLFGGFRLNHGFLTVAYNIRSEGNFGFDKGLFDLLAYGNSAFVGDDNPATANLNLNMKVFQELAVGYQMKVTPKLSIGARGKLLFGAANVATESMSLRLYTDPDTYALRVYEDIALNVAMPAPLRFEDGKLLTNGQFSIGGLFGNVGFAVDLGVDYQVSDRFGLVAAIADLGFIRWRKGTQRLEGNINESGQFYDNGSFLFEGLDIDQLQRIISDEYYRELFMDTLRDYFRIGSEGLEGYTTSLRTNLLLRGNFDIDDQNRVGAQVMGCFREDGFRPALTLAYSGSFYKMLDVCATYTMMRGSYANIGVGLAGNFEPFHIYLATSNIVGIFAPLNSKGFGIQAGIVFNFRKPDYTKGSQAPKYME